MEKQETEPKPLDHSNSTPKPNTNTDTSLAAETGMVIPSITSSLLPQPSWFTAKRLISEKHCLQLTS
ncbi:hypothetical protein A4A49_05563 [Nicotiana attenuata]|uniref:Uncharacterized protein n=1 Tax=Nicotiana attenuata TaxID=49451 RepID=A0A1J6JGM1_NICAT|nr:hypothetical protein A4A49_05563 [Nicotiana attenuata]